MQQFKHCFSSDNQFKDNWFSSAAFILLLVYTFSIFIWPDFGERVEDVIVLTGLIAFIIYGKSMRKGPLMLLSLFVFVQLFSWSLGLWQYPQWVTDDPRIKDLSKLFIFISIAWWLGGSTKNTLITWGGACFGFIVATFMAPSDDGWLTGLSGVRVGFDIRNNQHASMLFGVIFLGLICFSQRFWGVGKYRNLRIVAWIIVTCIIITGIAIGQTRAVWLSVTASVLFGLLVLIGGALYKKQAKMFIKQAVVILIFAVFVLGVLGVTLGDTIEERINNERGVVSQLAEGDLSEIPYTSIGVRINSWIAASEWISKRPLTGWGPKGRDLVMSETAWLPDRILERYGHLHNYFLETWVEYGAIGLLAMSILVFWIGRITWLTWRGGVLPADMAFFSIVFFVYWMIINQVESYNSFPTGQFVHNLIVGGIVTHYWRLQSILSKNSEYN